MRTLRVLPASLLLLVACDGIDTTLHIAPGNPDGEQCVDPETFLSSDGWSVTIEELDLEVLAVGLTYAASPGSAPYGLSWETETLSRSVDPHDVLDFEHTAVFTLAPDEYPASAFLEVSGRPVALRVIARRGGDELEWDVEVSPPRDGRVTVVLPEGRRTFELGLTTAAIMSGPFAVLPASLDRWAELPEAADGLLTTEELARLEPFATSIDGSALDEITDGLQRMFKRCDIEAWDGTP